MKKRFREWVQELPKAELEKMLGWQPLAAFIIIVLAVSVIGGVAPQSRSFLHLESPFLTVAISICAFTFFILAKQFSNKTTRFIAFLLGADLFVHLYMATLLTTTSGYGSVIFTGPWILCAAIQGWHLRTTLSAPYLGIIIGLATTIAAMMSSTLFQLTLGILTGVLAMCIAFACGSYATEKNYLRRESEQLRNAVFAQMLREEAGRADRFSTFIDQVAMSNHDIRNTLTIAIGNTSLMERLISEDPSEEDLKKATQKIRKSLSVLSAHMRSMAELSQQQLMVDREMETVEIVSLIETIVDSIRPRFENVNISIEVTALRKNITAPVSGGIVSARRMLDNLLINACEGNGVVTAKNIQLHIIETTDSVEIRVKDDGPGFSESQLATRNQAFKTTKPRGTGLGLYTSEQLVLASGGLLERMNNPSGGATVSIKLPKAAPV